MHDHAVGYTEDRELLLDVVGTFIRESLLSPGTLKAIFCAEVKEVSSKRFVWLQADLQSRRVFSRLLFPFLRHVANTGIRDEYAFLYSEFLLSNHIRE